MANKYLNRPHVFFVTADERQQIQVNEQSLYFFLGYILITMLIFKQVNIANGCESDGTTQ